MAEDWDAVAEEVAAAIADVGFSGTLEKTGANQGAAWNPVVGDPLRSPVMILDFDLIQRDRDGTTTGTSQRTLYMGSTGAVPATNDRIQVRGAWHIIADVKPLAPGGVDLLFEIKLQN